MRGSQPVSARARAAKVASQSTAISAAPVSISCEPTCAWMPSVSGARRSASSASSGGSPNFEPWWPVRMCSCVSASTPGVTRISVRVDAGLARAVDLLERVDDDERAGLGRGAELVVGLVVAVHDEAVAGDAGGAAAKRSSPSVETSAPMPSSARRRSSATFGNAFVP